MLLDQSSALPRARTSSIPQQETSEIEARKKAFDDIFGVASRQDLEKASKRGAPGGLEDQRAQDLLMEEPQLVRGVPSSSTKDRLVAPGGPPVMARESSRTSNRPSVRVEDAAAQRKLGAVFDAGVSSRRAPIGLAAVRGAVVAASARRTAKNLEQHETLPPTPERTQEALNQVKRERQEKVEEQDYLEAYALQQKETRLRQHLESFRPDKQKVKDALKTAMAEKAQAVKNQDYVKADQLKGQERGLIDHLKRLEGVGKFLANYTDRGKVDTPGVVYHSSTDVEVHKSATRVGVSYQINMVSDIDIVNESFRAVVDFNIVYKVNDEDVEGYNKWKSVGTITFQQLADDPAIKGKPPVFEIRNAITTPEFNSERVVVVAQNYDPDAGKWAWYAILYSQMRGVFKEKFELGRFPFVRTALQIQIQSRLSTQQLLFVPYNARTVLPSYSYVVGKGISQVAPRGNSYKTGKSPGTWTVETHHGFIIPEYMLPPMPSGNKFSTFVLCMQIKQSADFFIWNTIPVVFFLPIISACTIYEDIDSVADRMSITLTLLLTMAAYKNSIASWIPRKNYLTWMDWYMLTGFMLILMMSLWVGAAAMLKQGYMQVDEALLNIIERNLFGLLMLVWCALHVWIVVKGGDFYQSWEVVLQEENRDLKDIADDVTAEQAMLKEVIFLNSVKPPPPEHSALPSVVKAQRLASRVSGRVKAPKRALSK